MFSVVIPAYNAEKFICVSVNSVLAQTHRDLELIVVDDGSCDGTAAVIQGFDDARIKYVYQENGGVSAARNRGILESSGDFVCFLDADDRWKEEHLEALGSLIEKYPDCGMYVTGYDILLNNGEIIHKSEQILKKINGEDFLSDNGFELILKNGYFLNTNTICCRREVFRKVGLFEVGVKNGEDDDMWFRIFSYFPIAVTKKITTVYDRSNCGATGNRGEVHSPMFLNRVEGILSSSDVPQSRKRSLILWVEQNKLSRARKYILAGNKRESLKLFLKTDVRKINKKKYFQTLLCMFVPSKLVRRRIDRRDAGYYR